MNRHPFRGDAVAFGLFFLAVLGQWAVWEQDLLAPDDLTYIAAVVLILLGLVGIIATVVSTRSGHRTAPFTPEPAPAEPTPAAEPTNDPSSHQPMEGIQHDEPEATPPQ